jgi:hypothetical protein
MTTYSNPRMSATVTDWPSGKRRVTAQFDVEADPKRGQRAVRTTDGRTPKKLTYAKHVRIVDGDDGRIYIAEWTPSSSHISIMKGTMDYQHETIYEKDPRFEAVRRLFA